MGKSLTLLAGTPAYKPCGSVDFVTTAPAATIQPSPIVTPGKMTLRMPIQQPLQTLMEPNVFLAALLSFFPTS